MHCIARRTQEKRRDPAPGEIAASCAGRSGEGTAAYDAVPTPKMCILPALT